MAHEFYLPDIGEGLIEAIIIEWITDVGDHVDLDEPLVEVETDKAVVQIPAPFVGVLLHQGAAEGDVLPVGSLLAVIGDEGEIWSPEAPTATRSAAASAETAPIVGTLGADATVLPAGRPAALPAVRRLARELAIDLASVSGSGLEGRVLEVDVRNAAGTTESGADGPLDGRRVPLTATRRAIANNMARSWHEIPHVTIFENAAAGELLAARKRIGTETGALPPLEAVIVHTIIPVLKQFPEFNATFDVDAVIHHDSYNIGFAVDAPHGLMVAVVRDADTLSIGELAAEMADLAEAAKTRKITPDRLHGQTFTVSNIGAVRGGYGTPIIPFGTTAILSIGRADPKPVIRDDSITIAAEFPLSLSYDHRVIDGAMGRAFSLAVVTAIEGYGTESVR